MGPETEAPETEAPETGGMGMQGSFRATARAFWLIGAAGAWLLGASAAQASDAAPAIAYHYDGRLTVDAATGRIAAFWEIAVADEAETDATFLIRNTLEDIVVTGDIDGYSVEADGDFHAIAVDFAAADFAAADFAADGDARRVVEISYGGVVMPEPLENDINAIAPDRVELTVDSFWHPIDARFDRLLTSSVELAIDGAWRGVAPGSLTATQHGFRIENDRPALDISFTLARRFFVSDYDGFTVLDLREAPRAADALAAAARFCIDFLNTRFGAEDPLPEIKFAVHNRPSSGYNRKSLIALTDISDTPEDRLTQFICHELAHYWSEGGNFGTVENWLNESFAEYVGLLAMRDRYGEGAFLAQIESFRKQIDGEDLPPIWTPGATERRPYLVNYRKGPLALWRLEARIGRDSFAEFLRRYMTGRIGRTAALLEILGDVAGADAARWFAAQLAL